MDHINYDLSGHGSFEPWKHSETGCSMMLIISSIYSCIFIEITAMSQRHIYTFFFVIKLYFYFDIMKVLFVFVMQGVLSNPYTFFNQFD